MGWDVEGARGVGCVRRTRWKGLYRAGGLVLVLVLAASLTACTPRSDATQVATGAGHSCALLSNGQVKCWGANATGQLGDGTTGDANNLRLTPVTVTGLSGATQIATGSYHTCALVSGGQVKCWGLNRNGQLGDGAFGDANNRRSPVTVTGLSGATQVTAGGSHTCARLSNGQVRCWGWNREGQLGDGTTGDANSQRVTPVTVTGLTGVVQVAAGAYHTCARRSGGDVKCWGGALSGQIGDGTTGDVNKRRLAPTTTTGISNATQIATGGAHSCAVLSGGSVKCWGLAGSGQVGDGTTGDSAGKRLSPVSVSGLTGATRVAGGEQHTCAARSGGTVRCWGFGFFGQLGDGTTGDANSRRLTPVAVSGLSGAPEVAAGLYHSCALAAEGRVKCWGYAASGQLGDGTRGDANFRRLTPVSVTGIGAPG